MISDAFLIISLFFPRIVLLAWYLGGDIPPNTMPFWGDFFFTLYLPRVLILFYIYENLGGFGSSWFWVHAIFAFLAYGIPYSSSNKKRKT